MRVYLCIFHIQYLKKKKLDVYGNSELSFKLQFCEYTIKQTGKIILPNSQDLVLKHFWDGSIGGFFVVFFLFFKSLFILFIYFWLCWVFVAARGLSLVAASGGYSSLRYEGFSLRWLLLLESTGSRCAGFNSCGLWALELRLSSCGSRTELLCGMWDLPGPGLIPLSPALAGGFLTTAPPGKPGSIGFEMIAQGPSRLQEKT